MIATGSQIRAARAGLGWSQQELAGRVGIHAKAVQYWEHMGAVSKSQAQGWAPGRKLAALSSAGVEMKSAPHPAATIGVQAKKLNRKTS